MIQDRVSIMDMCDAVADALRDSRLLIHVQSYDELTESIPDTPLAQVFWNEHNVDSRSEVDRTTFGAEVRQSEYTIMIDVYAARISNFAEDMQKVVEVADEIDHIFEAQNSCPPFGLEGCKGFRWSCTRTIVPYSDGEYSVAGFDVTLLFS